MTDTYNQLFCRNSDYIPDNLQSKIKNTHVLIAGCGMGSTIAEAAVRIGFEHLTLVDGDTVQAHNLNRQLYTYADIGKNKVTALSHRLKSINPNLSIKEVVDWVTEDNCKRLIADASLILDTIDFLDLGAITSLHDEANKQQKPVISALNIGWGAGAIYCPPSDSKVSYFRKIFRLPETGTVAGLSYISHFKVLLEKIADQLDPIVMNAMAKAFQVIEDGRPCPASQLSAGSFAVASLAVTMAVKVLAGEKITQAPRLVLVNVSDACRSTGIDLLS